MAVSPVDAPFVPSTDQVSCIYRAYSCGWPNHLHSVPLCPLLLLPMLQVLLPYSQGALLDETHKMGKVLDTAYTETGALLTASVPRCLVGKLLQYATADSTVNSSNWGLDRDAGSDSEDGEKEGLEGVQLIEDLGERRGLVLSRSGSNSSSMSSV